MDSLLHSMSSMKCRFGRKQLSVLGDLVDSSGVRLDPDNPRSQEFSCADLCE